MTNNGWALKGVVGEIQGKTFSIKHAQTTLGRTHQNHVIVPDNNISRHHATFFVEDDKISVQDENSRNGVIVNDTKIPAGKKFKLKHGDRIQIGPYGFILEQKSEGSVVGQTNASTIKRSQTSISEMRRATAVTKLSNTDDRPVSFKAPKIKLSKRTLMYSVLGLVVLGMALSQFKPASKTAEPKKAKSEKVEIQSQGLAESSGEMEDVEITSLKAQARAATQYKDYVAALRFYEKIVKAEPTDENSKTQYEYVKKQLTKSIERHLENAKREYEKLNYERAIIEWKQVLALTATTNKDVHKTTQVKIQDAEKEMQKRR